MKLAEALVLRADIQTRLNQLRERLRRSAVVQEGERPPENPEQLLREVGALSEQLEALILNINRANLRTSLPDGRTLTEALARRDVLSLRSGILRALYDSASERTMRYSRTEIKNVPTVSIGDLQRQLDSLALERRELDTAIQATNWTVELEE